MHLKTLSEDKLLQDKVYAYLKHLVNQKTTNTEDLITLLKYMYGKVPRDKLHTQKEGIFDIYDLFSPKADDKERLMKYIITMSNHPSWIAALTIYSQDLGEDYADRNYKFRDIEVFKEVLESLLAREWGGLSVFVDRFLNSNMNFLEKLGETNPELITELSAMLDVMSDDTRYEVEDYKNPYGLEVLEQKYGSVLPRR